MKLLTKFENQKLYKVSAKYLILRQPSLKITIIKAAMTALIVMLSVGLIMPWVAQANPVPYSSTPVTEFPTLTLQTPEPNSPLYANNTLELNFNVTKPQSWNSYYQGVVPLVGQAGVLLYLDGEIKQTYSATHNTLDQYTAVLANLTQQQHTVWIDVYCSIVGGPDAPFTASVSQTLTFTIDAHAQTIAFHEDPIATTRPGTQSTVAPSPPPPTPTPTSTPTPTVPELSWLAIVPLLLSFLCIAVVVRDRKIAKNINCLRRNIINGYFVKSK